MPMKRSLILLALLVAITLPAHAQSQKKRKTPAKGAKTTPELKTSQPASSAVPVRVRYKNGRELYGRITDINMRTITIDAGQGSLITTPLQEVVSLNIGETAPKVDQQFLIDADVAYRALVALSQATEGITYQEYQPKVT